jgi:hypothetical protein
VASLAEAAGDLEQHQIGLDDFDRTLRQQLVQVVSRRGRFAVEKPIRTPASTTSSAALSGEVATARRLTWPMLW